MGKKGQVFILAAILIAAILFSLATIKNKSEQEGIKGDFEALSENFEIEASKLINSAMKQHGVMVHEAFKSFSTMFASYAKGKNPEYGLIYILSFEDIGFGNRIQVTNFLDRNIIIQGCGEDGKDYSVNISGGFDRINANLNFEGFTIQTDIVPVGLEFDCTNITSLLGYKEASVCAFLYQNTTELAVVIDGAPYMSCVKKGVPEIMQVGIMKQGEQAKVSASGECISRDFCENIFNEAGCTKCGKDVCFWWPSSEGCGDLCLNKYAYPSRYSGKCKNKCDTCCSGKKVFYCDTCKNLIKLKEDCAKKCKYGRCV